MSKDTSANPKWMPISLRKSWVRDWVCPLLALGIIPLWKSLNYWEVLYYLAAYLFTAASLATYWDWFFNGKDNFYMHGFMCGLASFPLYWAGFNWWAILISAVACGGLMGWWSGKEGTDWKEEMGRGAILAITRLLLIL